MRYPRRPFVLCQFLDAASESNHRYSKIGLGSVGQVLAFEYQGRGKRLAIQGGITARTEDGSLKQERIESPRVAIPGVLL